MWLKVVFCVTAALICGATSDVFDIDGAHLQKPFLFAVEEPIKAKNCTPSSINDFPPDIFTQAQREAGAVVVHLLVIIYMCGVMGIVCDRYFVPSLEIISDQFKLSPDVAGATLMAMGTSAPELFSSVIGSFVTEGDIGVGTIVGSAVFNILGITALIGLAVGKKDLKIDWFPISRDCLMYLFSVALLVIVISDNVVTWYEALIFLVVYVAYVIVMMYNTKIQGAAQRTLQRIKESKGPNDRSPLLSGQHSTSDNGSEEDEDELEPIFAIPDGGFFAILNWIIFLPANIVLLFTIPNVNGRLRCLYPLTFILSIVWIGLSSYITVWMVTVAGYTFGIPDTISGLTILAAGTSVPEIFASVLVAKNGQGNMALCNLLGSNIFDILFCLGAPWLVKSLIASRSILIQSAALTYISVTLLTTVAILFLTLIVMKWKVNYKTGILCLVLYTCFIVMACLYEFLVFGFSTPC